MRKGIDPVRAKSMLLATSPQRLKLGRNKTAERTPSGVEFRMYDATIFKLIEGAKRTVVLDLAGFWTPAVTKAMREYGEACGFDIKPSLAKGRFTAKYNGVIHEADYNNQIIFEV